MTPTLPDGRLLYAVGDIHGRKDLLVNLLRQIEADAAAAPDNTRKTLVFLGDYVDRGPDSRGVVDTLIRDLPEGFETHFLKGNHEAILLHFLHDSWSLDNWLQNGGDATMRSYGIDTSALARLRAPSKIWSAALAQLLPEAHLRFFQNLKLSVSFGDYLFVHAGIKPGVPLAEQTEADIVWIRWEFLDCPDPFGKIVVHGHTPEREPVQRPNRIGIDTGAVFTDRLTALRLEGTSQRILQT